MDLKTFGFTVEFAGCVWTEAVSGKKKLRIQECPDACGRSLVNKLYTHFSEALSTRIRIFLNLQLFLSGFKNFPVYTLSDSLQIYYFPLWVPETTKRPRCITVSGNGSLKRHLDLPDAYRWKAYPERKTCAFKIKICG